MASFNKDYETGIKNEKDIYETICKKFNDNIKPSEDKFCKYDYKGDTYLYELKTRNNSYSKYPTTLIPHNKIIKGNKQIFLFSFTDGLYYIKKNMKLFNTFDLLDFCRNKRIDYNDKTQLYYYIPIDKLKKI